MGKGQLYLESEAHKNYLSKLITDQWTEEEWLRLRQQGEHRMDARKQTRRGPGTNNVSVTKVGQMDGISTRSRLWNPRILLLLPLLRLSQDLVCGFRFTQRGHTEMQLKDGASVDEKCKKLVVRRT